MKNNQPVTQREVDYDESDVFVTRTDLKGIITTVNETFCRIAGFSEEELVGTNHNIVRHPDMPEWAFEDLWKTIKAGYPWRGIVKNRCKNGDHYWVRATVSPILRHGQVVGYLSLRKKPSRQEVAAAEALYRTNPKSAPASLFSLRKWFGNLRLQYKVQLLIQPLILVLLLFSTYPIYRQISASIVNEAKSQGDAIAMQVIDNANKLMVTGAFSNTGARQAMIKEIIQEQKLSSLRLVRTEQVVKQFGPGLPEEHLDDPLVKSTIETSVKAQKSIPYTELQTVNGKPMLRIITPYIESHDFHGTDCLTCHQVKVGSSNGASDMTIDLSAGFRKLHDLVGAFIVSQIALQIALYFVVGAVLKRYVVKPVSDVSKHLHEIVDGDFTRQVDIDGRDAIGDLLCAAQSNKVLMGAVIDQIKGTANEVDKHAGYLAQAAEKARASSYGQSEASHAMASNIEEISVSIDHVADNADEVHRTSEISAESAEKGGATVRDVIGDMASINIEVLAAANAVKLLGDRSAEIQGIVKAIRAIADQTNLLALNAAIEAARAGEQGRGFAVVADEVRKLAEQTSKFTTTISQVVDGIGIDTKDAIRMIEAVVEKVHHGEHLAETAGAAIAEIAQGTGKVLSGVSDITSTIHEQSAASREITVQVDKIALMAEENSASIMRIDDSAKTLEALSGNLKNLTDSFKV